MESKEEERSGREKSVSLSFEILNDYFERVRRKG